MIKEYSWNVAGFVKGDANKIGKELEIIEQTQELNSQAVLDYARMHPDSELHGAFEWDDSVAAEKYRISQASHIITNIRVNIIHDKKRNTKPIRAFVQKGKNQNYEPIEVFVKDTDKYHILLEKAYRELNDVKNRYADLTEIQDILRDIPEY